MPGSVEIPVAAEQKSGLPVFLIRFFTFTALVLLVVCLYLATRPVPPTGKPDARFFPIDPVTLATLPLATRFDFPMGSVHGALTYNAQLFTENRHLGDDLNGIGGGNTDLGDPLYAMANGRVLYAGWPSHGWGHVVLVQQAWLENGQRNTVQTLYSHLDELEVASGDILRRGQRIGTVGNARGRYLAHLHLEMRTFITPFIGAGYRESTSGWLDPNSFIQTHRGAPAWDLRAEPD